MIFMAFDGVVTKSIVCELQCLLGGKINKVFEPNRNEVLFGIYCNCKNYLLNASIDSANYRVNLTTHSKPNPQNALNFCMVLRKHLLGGIVRRIYSNGFERIVFIEVECHNELNDLITKTLVVELMGKHSNVILYDRENSIIIGCAHNVGAEKSRYRELQGGLKYIYPPTNPNLPAESLLVKLNQTNLPANSVIDNYYANLQEEDNIRNERHRLLSIVNPKLKKVKGSIDKITVLLKKRDNTEKYKLYGELLTANLYQKKDYQKKIF